MDEQLPHGNIGAANGSVRDAAIDRNDAFANGILAKVTPQQVRDEIANKAMLGRPARLISVFVPIL
jgi:hypothetical protein